MILLNLAGTVENKLVLLHAISMAGAKPKNTPLILRNLVQGGISVLPFSQTSCVDHKADSSTHRYCHAREFKSEKV